MMTLLNLCPRCDGDLMVTPDQETRHEQTIGLYFQCVQCGFANHQNMWLRVPALAPAEPVPAAAVSHRVRSGVLGVF